MSHAASRRIRKAGAPLAFAVVVLGAMSPMAWAVDEFATPRPTPKSQVPIKTQATVGTHATEVSILHAPNVVGQPVATARATLERSRLRAGRETMQQTSERPAGTVLGQDPKPGTPLQPGAAVNLVIAAPPRVVAVPAPSKNPNPGTTDGPVKGGGRIDTPAPAPQRESIVPNLIGRPVDVAPEILAKPGLNLGERRRQESDAAAGTVIAQFPAAGTLVHPGTRVDVTVAVESLVTVPNLTGETLPRAARELREYHLGLGERHERESSATPGTVIRQTPAPGTRVARGTLVNVLIATAPVRVPPPASTPYPPVVVTPPVVIAPPAIPPIVIQPPAQPQPPVVFVPPAPPLPPVVARPPAPPAPAVAPEPPLPPAPPVATAPQLPPPPAPPVVTAPAVPPAPIAPPAPAVVAAAPPAPAPIPKPTPKPRPAPAPAARPAAIPPAPAAPAPPTPPVVAPPPASLPETPPVRETPKRSWPSPIALGLGSVALLGAAGTAYYRVRLASGTTLPSITYGAHWDLGTQQIDAVAPLTHGLALRLQSGVEAATTTLETNALVATSHQMGGARR